MSNEIDELRAQLKELLAQNARIELRLAQVRQTRDGRDGLDGRDGDLGLTGDRGERGEKGLPGDRGLQGLAGDRGERGEKGEQGVRGDAGRDGERGERGADGQDGERGFTGKDGLIGQRGQKGDKGETGETGEIGPRPDHEWDGTKLRFEKASGVWGKYVDLRGERGESGGGRLPKNVGAGTFNPGGSFDPDSLGLADPLITPQQIIVKQNGVWLRMNWDDFVVLVGAPPPTGQRYADDYADHYTVYE